MEGETCEFSKEISKLRKVNESLNRNLQIKETEFQNLKNIHSEESKKLVFTIKSLNEQISELESQKNHNLHSFQESMFEYIEKNKNLEKDILQIQKNHFFESSKKKAVEGKKKANANINALDKPKKQETESNKKSSVENSSEKINHILKNQNISEIKNENSDLLNIEMEKSKSSPLAKLILPLIPQKSKSNFFLNKIPENKLRNLSNFSQNNIQELKESDSNDKEIEKAKISENNSEKSTRTKSEIQSKNDSAFENNNNENFNSNLCKPPLKSDPSQNKSPIFADSFKHLELIDQLEEALKFEEHEKKKLVQEINQLKESLKEIEKERFYLHNQILRIEQEKMEILECIENYKSANSEIEGKYAKLSKENARLEMELIKHSSSSFSEQNEFQKLKLNLTESLYKLNELQIKHNKLISENKQCLMDFDSKHHNQKRYILNLENEIKSLILTTSNLETRLIKFETKIEKLEKENSFLEMEIQRIQSLKEIETENKLNKMNRIISDLTNEVKLLKQHNSDVAQNEPQNLTQEDNLVFQDYLGERRQSKEHPESSSMFSYSVQKLPHQNEEEGGYTQALNLKYDVSDNKSQNSDFMRIKRGSVSLSENEGLLMDNNLVDNKLLTGNRENGEIFITRKLSSFSNKKRFSLVEENSNGTSEKLQMKWKSTLNLESEVLNRLKELEMTREISLKDNEISSDENNSEEFKKEEREKMERLFLQLNHKTEIISEMQTEIEKLKLETNVQKNELNLSRLKFETLEVSFKMFEQVHIQHVEKSQMEFYKMTNDFIESKIKCNEIQSGKDILEMNFNKILKGKDFELAIYKKHLEDPSEGRGGRRMTGLGRF